MASCTHWGQDAAKNTLAPKNFKSDVVGRTGLEDHRNDFYVHLFIFLKRTLSMGRERVLQRSRV